MSGQFDPSGDLVDVVDGLQAVTIRRPGSSTSTTIDHALLRHVRTRQGEPAGGHYTATDAVWHLPAAEITEPPRPGDLIVDAGGSRWTVLDVRQTALQGRWRCVCRDLAVAHGLDQYIDVQEATYAKSAGGADQATWQTWKTGLSAKIQPVEVRAENEHERRRTAARFRVFVDADVELDSGHRIRGSDGTIYRIISVRKPERIDALLEIDVERVG